MENKVYFYPLYERLWHWIQAVSVIILVITGFEISYASHFTVTGFRAAVYAHNFAAGVFLVNAFLALFYNSSTGLVRRYIPGAEDFFRKGPEHFRYYIFGIFKGERHPFDKTPQDRLLPLQKITYFGMLNVLLPVMIVTGLLKMSVEWNPAWIEMFGGIKVIGPLHRLGAWLFTAFLIVHVYMITTGNTIFSNLITMITGYEYAGHDSEEN